MSPSNAILNEECYSQSQLLLVVEPSYIVFLGRAMPHVALVIFTSH